MNIIETFASFMQNNGYGTLGTDLFISSVPFNAPFSCFWIIAGGGSSITKNATGEKQKNYIIDVFYRGNAKDVYDILNQFESFINGKNCDMANYAIIEKEAILFQTDNDLDFEDRTIGTVQVILTVYI